MERLERSENVLDDTGWISVRFEGVFILDFDRLSRTIRLELLRSQAKI